VALRLFADPTFRAALAGVGSLVRVLGPGAAVFLPDLVLRREDV
jgi:hypothetical protein